MADNFTRFVGDTIPDEVEVVDTAGAVMDITGHSFVMTVNKRRAPADNVDRVYFITGTLLDAPAGLVAFAPTTMQAATPPGTYYYDIQMTDPLGRVKTIATGYYVYTQDVTKN